MSEKSYSDRYCNVRLGYRKNAGTGLECWPAKVAIADHGDGERPRNSKCRVIIVVAGCRVRRIELRDPVDDLGVVVEGLKAVSETLRDVKRLMVLGCQFKSLPTKIAG